MHFCASCHSFQDIIISSLLPWKIRSSSRSALLQWCQSKTNIKIYKCNLYTFLIFACVNERNQHTDIYHTNIHKCTEMEKPLKISVLFWKPFLNYLIHWNKIWTLIFVLFISYLYLNPRLKVRIILFILTSLLLLLLRVKC